MKIIYLCAYTSAKYYEEYNNIDFNDINQYDGINIKCDAMNVDIGNYDLVLASPPCNYYSRANYRREKSTYSKATKHLLPGILDKCMESGKPFIIENVRNYKMIFSIVQEMQLKYGYILKFITYGRHTYITNLYNFNPSSEQKQDRITQIPTKKRQGGENVNNVFKEFIKYNERKGEF